MNECEHILLSGTNHVETSELSSNVDPVTDINSLKNEHRSRQARWNNLENDEICISGLLAGDESISFFAIPGHNLLPNAEIRLELFSDKNMVDRVYDSGATTIGAVLPLGIWRSGIDPYNGPIETSQNETISIRLQKAIVACSYKVTIAHKYGQIPPELIDNPPITISDGVYRQDEATGVLCMEAEKGEVEPIASKLLWENTAIGGASNGIAMLSDGYGYHHTGNDGPRLKFELTATQTGTFKVWLRMLSDDATMFPRGGYSIFTVFNGKSTRLWFTSIVNNGWQWRNTATVSMVAGQKYTMYLAPRQFALAVDKIVIKPSAESTPVGTGPEESGFGTTTIDGGTTALKSNDHVSLRMLMLGNSHQLENNFSYGSSISFLTAPDLRTTFSGFVVGARAQRRARKLTLSLDLMNDADRLTLSNHEVGLAGRSFLISPYPDRSDWFTGQYSMLAKFKDPLEYVHYFENIHKTKLTLLEA